MANLQKYKACSTGQLCQHYERKQDELGEYIKFGNQEIDISRTHLNYNLAPEREIGQIGFIQQRKSEIKCQQRKDVNLMCSWVITAPKEMSAEDTRKFFEESYKFMANRYGGDKNVISAYVHMDENRPHMHFAFVPVVIDKKKGFEKVSAKEVITKTDLQTFHTDLSKHMEEVFGRDIGVLNEATKEGNKSVEELKRGTAVELMREARREAEKIVEGTKEICLETLQNARRRVKSVQDDIDVLEAKRDALKGNIERLESGYEARLTKISEITRIQPQRTTTGAIRGVTVEGIENLKQVAIVSLKALEDVTRLTHECEKLERRCKALEKQQPSLIEQAKDAKEKDRLLGIERAFKRLPENVQERLLQLNKAQEKKRDLER